MSVMKHSPTFPPPPYLLQKITQKNVQHTLRSVHVHDIKRFPGCVSGSLQKTVPAVKLDLLSFILFLKKKKIKLFLLTDLSKLQHVVLEMKPLFTFLYTLRPVLAGLPLNNRYF